MNSRRLVLYQVDEDMIGRQEMARRLRQVRRNLMIEPGARRTVAWPVRVVARVRRILGIR